MMISCEGLKKMPRRNMLRDNAIVSALQQPFALPLFVVQTSAATLWTER